MQDKPIPMILALGEPMVEFNQTRQGEPTYLQGFGGDTSNFAIAAARQGARVGYISALGDDVNGAMLRQLWAREGVDATHVRTDAAAYTAIYFVTHGDAGHSFSFFRAGSAASRYRPEHVPREAIRQAGFLHLSGISLAISDSACDACYAAVAEARAAGVTVSFDTNLRLKLWPKDRARAVIADMIGQSDICLPSYDDVAVLFGQTDPNALVDRCLQLGARRVVLKMGAEGTLVADGKLRERVAPHPCHPVDATGAGDTFGGALIARLSLGDDLLTAARYAAVAAALSTQGFGAVDPIPDAKAVLAAMGK